MLSEWDGSAVPPIHRLPVFDEEKQIIVPTLRDSMPMSARWTCGTCHDYDTISHGFHFNSSDPDAKHGRPGEPWVWVDQATGTALPLSNRGWPGTFKPADLGITPWRFTQIFGRSLPGGDMAEPEDLYADPEARWHISGPAEVNCMACHNTAHGQDYSEWARQMSRENFRWAATAAAGMGEVGGMATRVRDSWTVHDGLSPDDRQFAVPPTVNYKLTRFDNKGWYDFQVGRPQDQNCMQCHATGVPGLERWQHPVDVHTAAGMSCVDCHREDLHHNTIRAYEGEATERGEPAAARFTCAGCHMESGDYGAPKPLHKGIPPVHFEKMTCTACHSGLMNEGEPQNVRTSRANRLGIYGRALWATDEPRIVETAFVRNDKGKIEPRKLMWPSYWVRIEGENLIPLTPDEVSAHTAGILDAPQQVATVLAALAQSRVLNGRPVFGVEGKWFDATRDSNLVRVQGASTATLEGQQWAFMRDGEIFPFLPPFDAAAETLDSEIETTATETIRALSALMREGEAVYAVSGKVLRRNADATLLREDATTSRTGWLWRNPDGTFEDLVPPFVATAVSATDGGPALTEEQVSKVLNSAQRAHPDRKVGYVTAGKLFTVESEGSLTVADHPFAKPYAWPVAHAVRPTNQSLGVKGCIECHSENSNFEFATITGQGPLLTDKAAVLSMHELEKTDPAFSATFGSTFRVRTAFKIAGWAATTVLAGLLLVYALRGLAGLARWVGGGRG